MNKFFGSKLNTMLLAILIILVAGAIVIMLQERSKYLPFLATGVEQKQDESLEILGNKSDLISFSIVPGSKVHGVVSYKGIIKGAYFFEGNIRIGILSMDKKILVGDHATATLDWMTDGPVAFEGKIDFSGLPKGPAYVEIHNDNPSDLKENDKSVLVPVVIE